MDKILVISAVWCPSCLILNKNLKKLEQELPDLKIEKLDYDIDEDEVMELNPGEILPVIIYYKNNIEEKRLIGEKTYEELKQFIEG